MEDVLKALTALRIAYAKLQNYLSTEQRLQLLQSIYILEQAIIKHS